jgi:hypothetical protein
VKNFEVAQQLTIYGKYAEGADLAEVGLDVKEVEILD